MKCLISKNPHGYDEISMKILKLSSQFITSLWLTSLINQFQQVLFKLI